MATSYNGWLASPRPADFGGISPIVIRGMKCFLPGVRNGDVHTVFSYIFARVDSEVEPIDLGHPQDDWGFSYRPNTNNPSELSCHASATAGDYNATRHPNGKGNTWQPWQKAKILAILAEVGNVVRVLWGYDEMHFEICASVQQVAVQAARIRNGTVKPGSVSVPAAPNDGIVWTPRVNAPLGSRVLRLGSVGSDVEFVQRWHGLHVDGEFGKLTEQAVRNTQERNRVAVDGVVGQVTWALMGVGPKAAIPPLPAAPKWDVPVGQYLGHIRGPAKSRGGAYQLERDEVRWLQQAVIVLGCVPGVGDWRDRWVDAKWEDATTAAVQMMYRKYDFHNEKYTDRVYREDWNRIRELVGR